MRDFCEATQELSVNEDRHEIKSPVLFIFAKNDDCIPLDEVGMQESNFHL